MQLLQMQKAAIPSAALIRFLRTHSQKPCFSLASPEQSRRRDCSLASATHRQYSTLQTCSSRPTPRHRELSLPRKSQEDICSAELTSKKSSIYKTHLSRRSFTVSKDTGIWDLFKAKKKTAARKDVSDVHTPLSSFLDESAGLGRIAKPVNELKLRCTEFDENGKVTLVNGEFKKSELIAKVMAPVITLLQDARE